MIRLLSVDTLPLGSRAKLRPITSMLTRNYPGRPPGGQSTNSSCSTPRPAASTRSSSKHKTASGATKPRCTQRCVGFGSGGIRIFAVETATDLTDQAGSIVAAVMGWRDEPYLDSLREKTHRGILGQIARGMSPGGRPYGYRSEPIYDQAHKDTYGQPAIVGYRRHPSRGGGRGLAHP
ncbi:MAG: hypothetical protein QN131_04915 [Armatimonadota bacterium]|nr:hypothetical protein [Armatimonadota bacterium]MDR7549267.1 hypothetical protein [Armatimonadota bacterium]